MAIFKSLVAATAFFHVALSSIAVSSEVTPSVATSIQFVSTLVAPSLIECTTTTVTEVDPPNTVTVTGSAPGSSSMFTITVTSTKEETQTITQTSEVPHHTTSIHGTADSTGIASPTSLTFPHPIYKNSTTMAATGTGGASASASYSPPPFTAAADVTNVGAATLAGGIFMALFGF